MNALFDEKAASFHNTNFTIHSLRTTVIQKLLDAGLKARAIMYTYT